MPSMLIIWPLSEQLNKLIKHGKVHQLSALSEYRCVGETFIHSAVYAGIFSVILSVIIRLFRKSFYARGSAIYFYKRRDKSLASRLKI